MYSTDEVKLLVKKALEDIVLSTSSDCITECSIHDPEQIEHLIALENEENNIILNNWFNINLTK